MYWPISISLKLILHCIINEDFMLELIVQVGECQVGLLAMQN